MERRDGECDSPLVQVEGVENGDRPLRGWRVATGLSDLHGGEGGGEW